MSRSEICRRLRREIPSVFERKWDQFASANFKGSKRGFVLARIGESIGGATTEELWNAVHPTFPDMKRSSLRAMLYLEAKTGNVERHGERYALKQDRPSAPTLDLSD